MADETNGESKDNNTRNGNWAWVDPFTTIFKNMKTNEVSSTCFGIGALLFLFILIYTALTLFSSTKLLTAGDIQFAFGLAIISLLYAMVWASIKGFTLKTKEGET